jgi:hypothetical protein
MLSDYGIENAGTKITDKEHDLDHIELPFIAHLGSDFVIVYKIEPDKVHYIWNEKKISISANEFLRAWTGIILLAEPSANSIEPDYKAHRTKEWLNFSQKALLFLAVCLIFALAYIAHASFRDLGLTLLLTVNLTGVYTGYLLVLKQMHIHSKYADKICSLFGQNDCNNVLESKAAKLWDVFGWSEIGLGYFVANVFMLAFLPFFAPYLAIINLFALPYSVWSVWYQKVKAKQWCPLCLIVQALLWSIFVLNRLFGFIHIPDVDLTGLTDGLMVVAIYGIFMLCMNLLIPQLSQGYRIESLQQEMNSIKANEDVFRVVLTQQPYYEVNPSDSQILFGDPDTGLKITILTNPYCNPCAGMHKRVEKFLKDTKNTVGIRYIFSSFEKNLDFANKYLIASYLEKEPATAKQIFRAWFEKGKPLRDVFFKGMHLNMDNPAIEIEFQKHAAWKEKTRLTATPTILVNGYKLPDYYKIEDLKYFTKLVIDVNKTIAEVVSNGQ